MKTQKYISKTKAVNAIKYTGKNHKDFILFCGQEPIKVSMLTGRLLIRNGKDDIWLDKNEWLIKYSPNRFFACSDKIFRWFFEKEDKE
jgi:hypothetical protein